MASVARHVAAILLVLGSTACGAAIPATAQTRVVGIRNLDCADCGERLAKGLGAEHGVYEAHFDKRKAEVVVVAEPSVDLLGASKRILAGEPFELSLGAGTGAYRAWAPTPEGADVKTIAQDGEDVPDLSPHLVRGKVTVVDFSATWCEPCRALDEHVVELLPGRADLAYRKAMIGDWDSPLAGRWLKGVPALPYVLVFDREGKQVDAISGLDLPRLDAALAKASR